MNEERDLKESEQLISFLRQKSFTQQQTNSETQKYSFNENGVELTLEICRDSNLSGKKYCLSSHNKQWIKEFAHNEIDNLKKAILDIQLATMPAEYTESASL